MHRDKMSKQSYTCNDYRKEMILLSLRRRLQRRDLSEDEKKEIEADIAKLEKSIGFL